MSSVDPTKRDHLSRVVGYVGGPYYNIDAENLRILYMSEVAVSNGSTSSSDK